MKIRRLNKLVISICMLIAVSFALVTATYAWYAGTDPTILEALTLTADDKGDLKVEILLESGERMDMSQVDANGASIDLALSKLINIEENKLGPGAFGQVHIFISSRSATYTSYDIKIIPNCDLVENGDEEVLSLAKEHICFYAVKTEEGYEQLIPYAQMTATQDVLEEDTTESDVVAVAISVEEDELTADGITGTIEDGEETEVVLYWYWPYEYEDVPDKTKISATNEREYDLQDTVIGNYIQSIGFTFVVEGKTDEE